MVSHSTLHAGVLHGLVASCLASACGPGTRAALEGTYTTTITTGEAQQLPEAAGTWNVNFGPDARFRVYSEGNFAVEGEYSVAGDTLRVSDEAGPAACTDAPSATYRWQLSDGSLVLTRIEDACDGRIIVLTAHPLSRKG